MKKIITISAFAIASVLVLNPSYLYTNIASPPDQRTGAPGELTCNDVGCHVGNPVNTNSTLINLLSIGSTNLNNGYTPGTTYNLSVNAAAANAPRYGFELTALNSSDVAAGDFNITNSATTTRTSLAGRNYVKHVNASSNAAWTFQWEAPATDVGVVTFYLAVNAANNNNENTGDQIHTTAFTVSTSSGLARSTVSGIKVLSADDHNFSIYPNPIKDKLSLSFTNDNTQAISVDLFSLNGQLVQNFMNQEINKGSFKETFALSDNLTKGLYLVRISMEGNVFFKKVFVD